MDELEPDSPHRQTALAMAALAAAFASTLEELFPDEEPLVTLQRKIQLQVSHLRRTPDAEAATAMFRFVRDSLRNPNIVSQPED
jgi:hypothetical protein